MVGIYQVDAVVIVRETFGVHDCVIIGSVEIHAMVFIRFTCDIHEHAVVRLLEKDAESIFRYCIISYYAIVGCGEGETIVAVR